jgi:hypothetical protein
MTPDLPPDPAPDHSGLERASLDRAGAWASGLCAIHCAAVALAPGLLVALGLGGALSHEFEWATTGAAVLIGVLAGVQGYRSHGSWGILAGFLTMAWAMVAVRFLDHWVAGGGTIVGHQVPYLPAIFATMAGIGMVWMHMLNLRRGRPPQEA